MCMKIVQYTSIAVFSECSFYEYCITKNSGTVFVLYKFL